MDNFDYNQVEFEDEWESVRHFNSAPVSYIDNNGDGTISNNSQDNGDSTPKTKRKLSGTQRIIKYQLILCALILVIVTGWKFISYDTFSQFREWYHTQLNSELVITDVFNFSRVGTDEI